MSAKANYFKIGLFVMGALTTAVITSIVFGVGTLFREKVMLETYIDGSVQGLDVGSSVKFRGVHIGNVKEITFVDQEYDLDFGSEAFFRYGRYVLVKIALEPGRKIGDLHKEDVERLIQTQIERGLRIRMASQGLTGSAYLELDYLDPERNPPLKITWAPKYYYVPSTPSTITQFTESVDKILKNLEKINIQGITVSLEKSLTMITQMIQDANIKDTREMVSQLIEEARETNKRIGPFLSDTTVMMESIQRLAEESEKPLTQTLAALQDLPEIFGYLKLILRRLDRLAYNQQQDIEIATENMRFITENIQELTANAKKYPSLLLFGKPPPRTEPGGMQ